MIFLIKLFKTRLTKLDKQILFYFFKNNKQPLKIKLVNLDLNILDKIT